MAMKTPRVNSAMLPEFQGRTVRLTGKVLRLEGETAILECSDNGNVTVRLNRVGLDFHPQGGFMYVLNDAVKQDSNFADAYVEVICKVTGDNTVSELTSYNLGDSVDMQAVEAVVQVGKAYPHLFTSENDNGANGY